MKSDYETLPREPETRYDLLCMVRDKNGNAHFKRVGRGYPLNSESGGLRLKVELDLILKESLRPLEAKETPVQAAHSSAASVDDIPF